MKRFLTALLAAALLLPLAACGGGTADPAATTAATVATETTAAPETVPPELIPPDFGDAKYDGYEFKFLNKLLGYGIYNHEAMTVEEETGEILNDAIYGRNRKVEELFGITIREEITTGNPKSMLQTYVSAGDNAVDVVIFNNDMMLGKDYLLDWYTIPGVNLDRLWYDQNFKNELSVNHMLFPAVSWVSITHVDCTYGMLFNKRIAKDYKIDPADIYQAVRDGKWTLDYFEKITKDMAVDKNGDAVFDDKDSYAWIGLDNMFRLGSGSYWRYASKDSKDLPKHELTDQTNTMLISSLLQYGERMEQRMYNPRTDPNTGGDGDRAVFRLFLNGQGFAYIHGFGSVQQFRDMEDDFGAVPPPKYDEAQARYNLNTETTSAKPMYVMSITEDPARTGNIFEALSYYGYTDLRPQYYESMMYFKYLRDSESVEMLDQYMIPNLTYRPNYGSTSLKNTIDNALKGTAELASAIASSTAAVEKELADYVKLYE